MDTALFDYQLPQELIAQEPIEPRDAARLLVAGCTGGAALHQHVGDLTNHLRAGDLLVLNRTRVIPARLFGHKDSGGEVEVLLIHPEPEAPGDAASGERWRCLVRGKVRSGTRIALGGPADVVTVEVTACADDGERTLAFPPGVAVLALAERIGHMPLPPYIRRADRPADRERYQTVFADRPGSVAAPTASLHLTAALLARLAAQGVATAFVELAIGPGTFKPVDCERLEDFRIHAEHCTCPAATVAAIQECKARGGRVIAVGTTVVRTLESAAAQPAGLAAFDGWTRIFLHPPQRLAVVDGLMTNFHLPRSSLLMLVACLTGVERLHHLYAQAIAERYRFFSYGDAMLLLPGAPVIP
ncbi:MAG: tRNA preQ1(34) S-adenosylmethionine ribosyltransferase-isomerase QueA [Planctomycetes bacterium]|nr:tRNA preQ1(34) S-adenosylmethionine ribosyltransferase-isomerase QueA [Planctomycetota bacterium]